MKSVIALCALALGLSGCASIVEGTSQEVTVNTNPAGANCALNREGTSIARVNPTPGAATIKKTKYDMTIVCDKPGFQQATFIDHSGVQDMTFGNIIFGGFIGWGIDSASGADNHYQTPVNITLVPATPSVSAMPPTPSANMAPGPHQPGM